MTTKTQAPALPPVRGDARPWLWPASWRIYTRRPVNVWWWVRREDWRPRITNTRIRARDELVRWPGRDAEIAALERLAARLRCCEIAHAAALVDAEKRRDRKRLAVEEQAARNALAACWRETWARWAAGNPPPF
jgi:hypothetical protein